MKEVRTGKAEAKTWSFTFLGEALKCFTFRLKNENRKQSNSNKGECNKKKVKSGPHILMAHARTHLYNWSQ